MVSAIILGVMLLFAVGLWVWTVLDRAALERQRIEDEDR